MTSGTAVTLTPFETASGVKAGIVTVSSTWHYWVEYRTPVGKDKNLPPGAVGVQVRLVASAIGDGGPLLLDARVADGGYDAFDTVTLPAGSSWTAPENIRISVGTVTSSGAVVTALGNAPRPP